MFLFVCMLKLIFKNEINSSRKFIQKSSVIKKELTTLFRDSKKNMSMRTVDDILRNVFSPNRGIFKAALRTKSRFTCKRKFMRMPTRMTFIDNEAFI